jgi:radical SAM protein (TIGR01212 family)
LPKQLFTFGKYLRSKFGENVYKIPIALSGFTCPNIDGTVAKGGCTFCLNDSFSPNLKKKREKFYLNLNSQTNPLLEKQLEELESQILNYQKLLSKNYKAKKFLVYFQAFTNTYAPFETLEILYKKALSYEGVVGISIGTRSDSITDETLEFLVELAKKNEIWVEYGIQSIYDETLRKINRGHDSKNVQEAIKKTKELGLNVCGHLIFGLPGEDKKMMLNSAQTSYKWGIDSVKYHPLYVVKNTLLANEYKNQKFKPIEFEEYVSVLIEAIKLKPQNISIQRITAGIEDETLLAPTWCGYPKQKVISLLRKKLLEAGFRY